MEPVFDFLKKPLVAIGGFNVTVWMVALLLVALMFYARR